jgi:hypothetical protein
MSFDKYVVRYNAIKNLWEVREMMLLGIFWTTIDRFKDFNTATIVARRLNG